MLLSVLTALAAPAYVRSPDLHGDTVVFAAAGDLWVADIRTGAARALTSHPGDESVPSFSPDGKTVAFTAMYDGNADVYVVPTGGGEPRRLTWHPARDEVVGWTPDGKVLFRSGALHPHGSAELYAVPAAGGDPVKLPLGWAARLAIDPASGLYAFDRLGYERRTWKRYRGGTAGDLWVGDPGRADFRQLTATEYSESFPMWSGGRLYFLSDRGGTADLWSMAPDGQDPRRHTTGTTWDVRTPAVADDGRIVYTRAADIWIFDPRTGREAKVEVAVEAERALTRRRYPYLPGQWSWFTIAPDADRLAVTSRGEVFSVPVEPGVVLPITRGSGARERWGEFSPDGKRVVYVTDQSGEEAIVTADAWGRGDVKTVKPPGASGWFHPPEWSPDGSRVAWSDQDFRLWVAPAGGGTPVQVDRSPQREIREYAWSPDGRFLGYTRHDRLEYGTIHVWDSKDGQTRAVSPGTTDDHSPAWDPEGRYLYYASERGTNPWLGTRDFQVIEQDTSRLVMVLLRKDVADPFARTAGAPGVEPPVAEERKQKKKERARAEEPPPGPKPVTVDWEGLLDRQVVLPVPLGSYGSLVATDAALFWMAWRPQGLAGGGAAAGTLMALALDADAPVTVLDGVGGYELATRAGKLAVAKDAALWVIDARAAAATLPEKPVDLSGMIAEIEPREEWRQIFHEAWRNMRDFHWDAALGGLDWPGIRDQYATLLPRLSTRAELNDLLGEMIGELATSHTYVGGGDAPLKVDWVGTGLLGAELTREGTAYRVTRVYRGDPADEVRSPLAAPGAEVREGEYILAVNHQPFAADEPWLARLEGKAGVPVLLTVNTTNSLQGARQVVVTPVGDESRLLYVDWVRKNREYVAARTNGRFGYVHVPDMGVEGLVAFETWFYPQLDKQGMVVDVRWNGGGFVSQLLVERLRRPVVGFDRSRGGGIYTYPARTLNGPFVVLTNEFAGSDGDIFPRTVQVEELAPVIGARSWGGVVGIRGDKPLVDGGFLTQPEYAYWYPDVGWGVENYGVDPDIPVQNLPQEVARGVDAQLDRGLQELERLWTESPPLAPAFGPEPKRTRDAYRDELE